MKSPGLTALNRLSIGLVVMALSAGSASAQQADPIDDAMKACLGSDAGNSTAGMLYCYDAAATAWDKRLNVAYSKLMKTLDPVSKSSLIFAERAWIAFRDKDTAFRNAPWRQRTGTLSSVVFADNDVARLKARALELEFYLASY